MNEVYLLIGVPGSGKTWVMDQLENKYTEVRHDHFIGKHGTVAYVGAIKSKLEVSSKPILAEAPFSISEIKDPLEKDGILVKPVFILEDPDILSRRYKNDPNRDGKDLPKGHLTRMKTYTERAKIYGAFSGNSSEVLDFLKMMA